jgi:hypothetical protein
LNRNAFELLVILPILDGFAGFKRASPYPKIRAPNRLNPFQSSQSKSEISAFKPNQFHTFNDLV